MITSMKLHIFSSMAEETSGRGLNRTGGIDSTKEESVSSERVLSPGRLLSLGRFTVDYRKPKQETL